MSKMMGYCGIDCTGCPAFVATQSGDPAELAKVAKQWAEQFKAPITPESVECYGCGQTEKAVSVYCKSMCAIRNCAQPKNIESCADCKDYGCKTLSDFIVHVPQAKEYLESRRAGV